MSDEMHRIDKALIEKYFDGTCTAEEAGRVLNWFETPAGSRYLKQRMRRDGEQGVAGLNRTQADPDSEVSDKMLNAIRSRIRAEERTLPSRKDRRAVILRAAAALLVLAMGSLFYLTMKSQISTHRAGPQEVHYITSPEQQQRITLEDGTEIRLNESSEIRISDRVVDGVRRVWLEGEAYFDVAPNPSRQFVVEANQSAIRVLGTAFNIRSRAGEPNVQVAVMQGRVSFGGVDENESEQVILQRGEYGFMDLRDRSITVDDYGVENYLSWLRGRLNFQDQSLEQICTQLNRLYELTCSFETESFRELRLTADFSNDSIDKTLLVIALSLDIGYERKANGIRWVPRERMFE